MEQEQKNDLANALQNCAPLYWSAMLGGEHVEKLGIIISPEAREKIVAALTE